jgi:hypothetical protein
MGELQLKVAPTKLASPKKVHPAAATHQILSKTCALHATALIATGLFLVFPRPAAILRQISPLLA